MRWLLLLALATSAGAQSPSQTEQVIDVKDIQACGLITRFPGDIISPNCFPVSNNILSDRTGVMTRRLGYSQYNSAPCEGAAAIRGMWPFFAQDGTQYLIMFSSTSMFSSPGDGSCTPITGLHSVLSPTATMECVQSLGQLWCTDGTDVPFATNVKTETPVTQAPIGLHIGTFRNRILISGVPGTGANGSASQVFLSGELNGFDWTIPAVQLTTSPAIISINGINDGLIVNCLMGEFQNQFLIGRNYDLWGLSGYDLSDFALRKISSQVGCLEPRSVQEVTNVLYWLSFRGIEGFSGTQINRVSYPIDPLIATVIASAGNVRTQTLTTQADWQSGNLVASGPGAPISATRSPGDLQPSSFSFIDTTFVGTFDQSVFYNNADLRISTGSPFQNAGFEFNSFKNWTNLNWSTQPLGGILNCDRSNVACTGDCNPLHGAIGNTTGNIRGTVEVYATGGVLISSITTQNIRSTQNCLLTPININASLFPATSIYLHVYSADYTTYSMVSSTFNNWSNGFSYGWSTSCVNGGPNTCVLIFDISESTFGAGFSSGTFTSKIFNTGFSTPIVTVLPSTTQVQGATANFSIRSSTSPNNDFWSAWKPIGSNPNSQYFEYGATFTATISTMNPSVNSVDLEAETTGFFISPCILVSTPTSFGNFLVDGVTNGGSFTFWISTGATCAIATRTNANWTLQTPNSIISVATTTTFIAMRALFFVDVATEVPTLADVTFTFTQGGGRPPTTSARWDDRYLLFFTSSTTGTPNDHVIIYDQNQKWQLWDDEPAASAALYLNTLYTGDSNATGLIYQQDVGQSDNGNAFTMTFQTADFDGGDPNMRKQFTRAYLMMSAPSGVNGTATLNCNYAIDGSTLTYSLGQVTLNESPENTGYFVAKIPFPVAQPVTGHYLNLSCGVSGTIGPVAIHRMRVVFSNLSWD